MRIGRTLLPAGTTEILRHAPFRHQFMASSLSMVGSALTPVALALGVLQVTGSPAQLGIVLAAYSVPQVLFMLVGGVWADRLPRQRVMMGADGVRVVTQTLMGVLLVLGHTPLWSMVVLQALCGTASAFFLPASVGLVADTAPEGRRQEANALLSLTRNLTGTIGPIVASGLVVAIGAGWALVVDGLTFAASMYFLHLLTLPPRPAGQHEEEPSVWRELVDGWREVSRRSWVWSSIVYAMVFNLAFATFQVLGPATLVSRDSGAWTWGLLVAGLGLGQLLGNTLALSWRPELPMFAGRLVMFGGAPILLLLGLHSPLWVLALASVVCGVAISLPDTLWDVALQEHIDGSALSRVVSFDFLGSLLLRPVGLGLAAALAGVVGTTQTLVVAGLVMLVATAVSLADPMVRHLRREPATVPAPQTTTAG